MKAPCNLLVLASSLLCAVAPLAFAIDDPFADTKFHYLGGGQVTAANDFIKSGDFPDARFAADASSTLHGATVADPNTAFYASYTNDAIRLENVVCPYSGITLTNVPCIHFAQQTSLDGNGTPTKIWPTYLQLPELFSVTDQCTVFLRFKCEGFPVRKDNFRQTLLSLGHNKAIGAGYLFGITGTGSATKFIVYCGKSGSKELSSSFKTNVWVEVACVISGSSVKAFFDYETGYYKKPSATLGAVDVATESASRRVFKLGGEQRCGEYDYGQDDYWRQFRGSIHEVAIWDRALTEGEVRQVFAGHFGGNSLWRYGTKDGASGEFTGTQDAITASPGGGWRPLKPTLTTQNPSVTVNFTLPHTTDATIPKRLVIDSAAVSPASRLAIAVNGTQCGTLSIQPDANGVCEIPTHFWTATNNSVSVQLVGGGPFTFDAIRLENVGWQIGYTGKNTSEFRQEDDSGRLFTAECANWKAMNRVLLIRDWRRTLEVHFTLTPDDAKKGRHTLTWAMWNGGSTTYPKTVTLTVNGSSTPKETVAFPASASTGDLIVTETEFEPGELADGDNYFTFTGGMANASDSQQGYISIDYFRLDSRFEKGVVVILR